MAGILVMVIGLGALLDRVGRVCWARHWPLLFLPLGIFLVLLSEPSGWPLGNVEGFWETLVVPTVLQHRLATLLVIGLGLFEWRVHVGGLGLTRWRFVFPLLCLVGGALLLTHSHTLFSIKREFLIEVSHAAIGVLAVLVGTGRWLELRLPLPANRFPAFLWTLSMVLVGLVLLFYRET
jgi:putative copper resistance protein D